MLFLPIIRYFVLVFLLVFSVQLCANGDIRRSSLTKGIVIDLNNPTWSEGLLETESGGVIQGPDIRIQARKIRYTRQVSQDEPLFFMEAEGDLVIEFGGYIFVGCGIEYDFQTRTGVIYEGRSARAPWFFGGREVHLCPDGSYLIYDGFITTSESTNKEWEITAGKVCVFDEHLVQAKNVKFKFFNIPLLWLPSFKTDLYSIFDSPIRYLFRWGGHQGTRFGVEYEVFSWCRWKLFTRVDYRVKRGFGGGIHASYRSADHKEEFSTINYIARDNSISNPHETYRYRFQGVYHNLLMDDTISMDASWDKLSDRDMATDYSDKGLELDTAGRTQASFRRQTDTWIANLYARARINSFQTVKQELPTWKTSWKAWEFFSTGIITDSYFKTSYLDYKYANNLSDVRDYNSTRIEASHRSYRPFTYQALTLLPEAGAVGIYYGNTPRDGGRWTGIGLLGCELNTNLHRFYGSFKHVLTPYCRYDYYTCPSLPPNRHYVFDIEDGWFRLNTFRWGVRQNFYRKYEDGCIGRYLLLDVWANAFFKTPTIPRSVPYLYTRAVWNQLPTLRHTLGVAWDFERSNLSYFNMRTEWTVSTDLAVSMEYRHRNGYSWRKVDPNNFILDTFRSERSLHRSELSDRRDTLLVHMYYRFDPRWALEVESRQGWNRRDEPNYYEYEIDLIAFLRSAWKMKVSYQHKMDDHRFALYISVGLSRPDVDSYCDLIPCVEF